MTDGRALSPLPPLYPCFELRSLQKETPRPEAAIGAGSKEARGPSRIADTQRWPVMFERYQNLKAPGLKERILTDLTLRY